MSKIGKKYFYVENEPRMKFNIETLLFEYPDYSQWNVQAYLSIEDIEKKNLYEGLLRTIRNYFYVGKGDKLSLEQLKQIAEILKIYYGQDKTSTDTR